MSNFASCPGFESRQLEERNLDRMEPSRLMNDTLSGEAKDQASLPLSRDSNRNPQDAKHHQSHED